KIFVAGDLSELARMILRKTLAWFPDADVGFFHAVEVPNAQLADVGAEGLREQACEAARAGLVDFVDQAGLPPDQRGRVRIVCEPVSPLVALNTCLRRETIDLVVVGANGVALLFEILFGRQAMQNVEDIPTDVLIARSPAQV